MTTTQVARYLSVCDERIRQLCAEGKLRSFRTSLGRIFSRSDVQAYQAQRSEAAAR